MLRTLKNRLVFFVMVLLVGSSASVFADTVNFQWEDTTSDVPGSEFTLTLEGSGQFWSATLMVNTALATFPGWYLNYITLHLDGGQNPTVSGLMFNGAPPVNWSVVTDGTDRDLLKRMHFPQNSWVGLYTNGIDKNHADFLNITQGVPLDNGTATWTFYVDLAGGVLNEAPSIQVGYYNGFYNGGGKYKVKFTQMSQSVPEPSTLILLLSGTGLLAGAVRFGRKT